MSRFSPRNLAAHAALLFGLTLVSSPAFAYEVVQGDSPTHSHGNSNRIATNTPIRLTQYSLQQQAGNEYAYFAFNVGAGRRSLIVLYNLDDPQVKALHELLLEAYRSARGIRWLRNEGASIRVDNSGWQGYATNTIFPVWAGHRVEIVLDR
jgi:hypothetical protein